VVVLLWNYIACTIYEKLVEGLFFFSTITVCSVRSKTVSRIFLCVEMS
jgi:hypothetical protein